MRSVVKSSIIISKCLCCSADLVDGAVGCVGARGSRRYHQGNAMHQAAQSTVLSDGRQHVSNASITFPGVDSCDAAQIATRLICENDSFVLHPFPENSERIEVFIDDNKALMRRMYGDFSTPKETPKRKRDTADYEGMPGVPDITAPYEDIVNLAKGYGSQVGDSYFAKWRTRRQANKAKKPTSAKPSGELNPTSEPVSDRLVSECSVFAAFSRSSHYQPAR